MIVLGIESSCDETAIAIVHHEKKILSNKIYSQIKEHSQFGGVVPEIAARSHIEVMPSLFEDALKEASIDLDEISAIAVTGGPGLIGGLMVGVIFAKTVASMIKKPFIAVNHLEGHALTVRLTHNIEFPYLLLLASGGHCQFLLANGLSDYQLLSTTIDDAAGEAFDKVAKMLGLGYPGGPLIEKAAQNGNPNAFKFPMPLCESNKMDMSFSGLKTAVRIAIEQNIDQLELLKNDICASFQEAVSNILIYKTEQMIKNIAGKHNVSQLVISGGVAANIYIRDKLYQCALRNNYNMIVPPVSLCTDNAAMIAWAGLEKFQNGIENDLAFEPRSRWPLWELS